MTSWWRQRTEPRPHERCFFHCNPANTTVVFSLKGIER